VDSFRLVTEPGVIDCYASSPRNEAGLYGRFYRPMNHINMDDEPFIGSNIANDPINDPLNDPINDPLNEMQKLIVA
jgi:hypothetical protein